MPRKTDPEKDGVILPASASAAPVRERRATATPTPRPATAARKAVPARDRKTPARTDTVIAQSELSHEDIARLAYALWEARGCHGGNPDEDWLRAEQQLRQQAPIKVS